MNGDAQVRKESKARGVEKTGEKKSTATAK